MRLIHKGSTLDADDEKTLVFNEGDTVLLMPQRKAPSSRIVSAVVEANRGRGGNEDDDDEDEDTPASLPSTAPKWEAAVVDLLRHKAKLPEWVMEWVVLARPMRMVLLLGFIIGCYVTSRMGLGPVFVLACIVVAIFTNLGKRREGELSAYSIFNPQAQRLPGQLDADHVDRHIRGGAGGAGGAAAGIGLGLFG